MSTRARALLLSAAASAVGVAQPFAPGQLVALRTAASADVALGQTLPAFVDVLSAATGELVRTINLPVDNSTGGLALTLRRSTVEGHFARSEDGCTVTVAGYNVAPFTPNAAGINNPTVARSAAVIAADGSVTSATGDLALAQLPALARGAAILPGAGLYFSSDYGMSLNVTLNTTRVGPPALLSQSNTRSAFVYRGALLTASASNVPPSQAGVWILNPDLSLPLSPLPANSSGLLLASAPAPYGAAVIDDFTIIVADQSSGLMLFRSALTLPGAAPGSPWTSGWLLVATATDPGLAGNGFSHVGVDTSSGQVGLAAGVYATTFKAATDNDNAARVSTLCCGVRAVRCRPPSLTPPSPHPRRQYRCTASQSRSTPRTPRRRR